MPGAPLAGKYLMKIVRKPVKETSAENPSRIPPWRVLVVDDEPDILRLTELNLRGFEFAGRPLELIAATSAAEAREKLGQFGDIALALIDVVMESDDAGLKLVEHIRKDMNNRLMRLIIRTGQPGVAPERFVIDNFDIDDYKDKTELTVQKLYTTVRSGLKGYRDLRTIELNRLGLARILDVTPELYNLHLDRLEEYFRGVLTQIIGICNLEHSGLISTIDGLVATLEGKDIRIRAGTGEFGDGRAGDPRRHAIAELCSQAVLSHEMPGELRQGALVVALKVKAEVLGFVYLESRTELTKDDRELIQVMANQCAAALDNFRLHHSLEESYDEAIDMLAYVAEFKDSATGRHVRRIQEYTRRTAKAMGCSDDEAAIYAKASRLHDVGKVGIPDSILRKPGKLTEEEYAVIQRHTRIGDAVLSRSRSLAVARVVAKSHHERWDGSGYPTGLAGQEIPLAARVVAVVDVFDALVSLRPYKLPWSAEDAAAEIVAKAGQQFDPDVVTAFIKLYREGRFDDLIAIAAGGEDTDRLVFPSD
jgi:response regulator RpfG family c-di-GMP phosphodiesterase